jgi:hypothetical protein
VAEGVLQGTLNATGEAVGIAKRQKSLFVVRGGEGVHGLARGVDKLKDKTVMAKKRHPGWTSVFSAIPGVTAEQLRALYREAGVHIYCDSGDVLSANEAWLMLHTRAAGTKHVILPKACRTITEITTEKIVAENAARFQSICEVQYGWFSARRKLNRPPVTGAASTTLTRLARPLRLNPA